MAEGPRIVKGFEKLIEYVVDHEAKVAEAISGQSKAKPWLNMSGDKLETKATEKTEEELGKVFNRDDANEDYEKARADEKAKSKQVALAKLAGDFLAACERDKRAQWRTRLRMVAHAASRRFGNGLDSGPVRRNTLDYLSRIYLKAREIPTSG
jgi:hypothetical protein